MTDRTKKAITIAGVVTIIVSTVTIILANPSADPDLPVKATEIGGFIATVIGSILVLVGNKTGK